MAGILDFLQTPDAQLGIGLLAAGGPSTTPMNLGQRVQMAMQGMDAQKQSDLKLKLLQSQVDENSSQAALRQASLAQQAKRDAYFMGDAGASGPAIGGVPGAAPAAMGTPSPMGQPGSPTSPGAAPAAGDKFSQWSAQYGIPRDALVNDYMTNGGKGIAEMLMKRGTPDMQVSNGYAYDKNRLGAGFLPQLNTSQDGKSSMIQIGPDGLPVVSAPRGAVETFGAYQGAQANYKPIKVFNPQTQREEYTTEGAVVGAGRPQPMGTVGVPRTEADMRANLAQPDSGNSPRDLMREIATTKAQMSAADSKLSPQDKAMLQGHIDNLTRQLTTYHGGAPEVGGGRGTQGTNLAAGPSAQEKSTAVFGDKMATEQADLLTKSYTAANDASNALAGIQESRKAMQAGAFQGTGAEAKLAVAKFGQAMGISIDPEKVANTDYLKSTLGNGLLEKAKTLGSNPSNADASRITDIVGSIGKDPNAMAKILDWQEAMAQKSISGHNTRVQQAQNSGFKSQFDMTVKAPEAKADAPKPAGKVFDALPTPNGSNKGQRIRDTTTGKILVSNGLQWKEQ